MRFRLVPKSSTLDDHEWPWTAKTHFVAEKMRHLERTAQIWMKIDPYYQRQKCRPMILVSGNIRLMQIFAGFLFAGASNESGLSTTAIFDDLSGYFFWIFRDKVSDIIRRYPIQCRPVTDCKMNDLEWPSVAIWRQNPFSASTLLQNRCVFWSPLHKFEWR